MNEARWKWWREVWMPSDLSRAMEVERLALEAAALGREHPGFAAEQHALSQARDAVRLGRLTEGPRRDGDLWVAARDMLAHQYVLGVSGSGKTFFLVRELLALLAHGIADSVVIIDPKAELSELLTDAVLPAVAAGLPPAAADAFLKRIVVIDPFSSTHLPPLNVLVRDPGVPVAVQARDVAECFEAATETDVSARMETIFDWTLRLVIETGGSFLTVRRALQEPTVLEGLVRLSKDRDVIRYFLTRYPSEPKASKLALLARLDRFLALPMTQLSVGAKGCLDFDRLLKDRITLVSLGNAPAGLQSVARFFAMVILTRFVRAIFRLPARAQGFNSVILADEWQVTLNRALASEFESILTLARSRGVHLWLANQQLAQLDGHGTALKPAVLGGSATQVFFRLATEDARALRSLLPTTGTVRRQGGAAPTGAPFLTPAEELDWRMAAVGRSPNRHGYFLDKRKAWGAFPFRSATLSLPSTASLPPAYVDRARRGAVAFTVQELERMRDAEDARLDRLAAGPARAHAAPPVTPSPAPGNGTPPGVVPAKARRRAKAKGPGSLPPIR